MSLIRLVMPATASRRLSARRARAWTNSGGRPARQSGNGVTGFLLATQTAFAQVLEARMPMSENHDRIMADPRHDDLRILSAVPRRERPCSPQAGRWRRLSRTR